MRIHGPLATEHHVELDIGDGGIAITGNADQIRQLMLILLDNARMHTPAGSTVRLAVASNGNNAVISVADDGPGFKPEHRTRIFDRFYRTDGARARSSGGTGLGLAIARWIVESHGGEISADSVPGEGATFTATIPRILDSAHPGEQGQPDPAPSGSLIPTELPGIVRRSRRA